MKDRISLTLLAQKITSFVVVTYKYFSNKSVKFLIANYETTRWNLGEHNTLSNAGMHKT